MKKGLRDTGGERNLETIKNFRARYAKEIETLDCYERDLERVLAQDEDHLYYYLTLLFGRHVFRAYLSWADEAISLLAGGTHNFPGAKDGLPDLV